MSRVRHEWVDAPRVLRMQDEATASLANFAYESTDDLLNVEPRLVGLAFLVDRCARAGELTPDAWWAVDSLASMLVGPSRSVSQTTAVNTAPPAVTSSLRGEVIRRRYLAALRKVASEAVA